MAFLSKAWLVSFFYLFLKLLGTKISGNLEILYFPPTERRRAETNRGGTSPGELLRRQPKAEGENIQPA